MILAIYLIVGAVLASLGHIGAYLTGTKIENPVATTICLITTWPVFVLMDFVKK